MNQTIGINMGHNSSAVLVIDDVQVLRLEEEKIVQKKWGDKKHLK